MPSYNHIDNRCGVFYHTTRRFLGWVEAPAPGEKPMVRNGSFNEFRAAEPGDTVIDPFGHELIVTGFEADETGNWKVLTRPIRASETASRWEVRIVRERTSRQVWSQLAPSKTQVSRARRLGMPEDEILGMNKGQISGEINRREYELEQERFDTSVASGRLAVGVSVYRLSWVGRPRPGPYKIKFIDRNRCVIGLEKCPGAFKPWNLTRSPA